MTRPPRIEFPGALYHVISRGNEKQEIYFDDRDRRVFLNNLEQCIGVHNLICHAYCLMNNHYHLLLETPDGNLSKAMRDINGDYAQKFNERHGRVGHLWQGRYKSFLIEKDLYFLEVVRYIVNNPVKAELVNHPKKWKWSSYGVVAGERKNPQWLENDFTLSLFSSNTKDAQKEYRSFVKKSISNEEPYNKLREGTILGSPQFVAWVWEEFKDFEKVIEFKKSDRMISRPSLDELFDTVKNKLERDKIIKFARIRTAYSVTEIANHLKLHRSTVSKILNK